MEISITHLRILLSEAAELGAIKALAKAGVIRPFINKSEAFKLYGRTNIEKWLKAGLITPRKDGAKSCQWRLERSELETVAKANNWSAYIPIEDR